MNGIIKYILLLVLVLGLGFTDVYGQTLNQEQAAQTIASAQSTTGVSASECFVGNKDSFGLEIVLGGTSGSVAVECQLGANTSWVVLTGTGTPVTTITTTLLRFNNHSQCENVRTNLTACTTCTLTVYCK